MIVVPRALRGAREASVARSSNLSFSGLRRAQAERLSGFGSIQDERTVCNGGTNASRGVVTMARTGKFFVGGNWKANGNKESVNMLVQELNDAKLEKDVGEVVAVPYIYLDSVLSTLTKPIEVSAQNSWVGKDGAFAGEIRIRQAEKKKNLSLQQKFGRPDVRRLERGHFLGLGPRFAVGEETWNTAVTCYAKDVRCSTEGQGQTQTIKNETIVANKAPLQSKERSPKLDDGGTGLPPRDGDGGGGGGGGGGGWRGGGFVFWALLLLIGFLRDRELDKPYDGPKRRKKQKRRQFT